jgi:hypothetical protein
MKIITDKNEINEFLTKKDNVILLEIFSSDTRELKNHDIYIDLTFKATIMPAKDYDDSIDERLNYMWGNSKYYTYYDCLSNIFFSGEKDQELILYKLIANILNNKRVYKVSSIHNLFESGILDEFTVDINNINKIEINETKPFIELKITSSRLKLYSLV